MGASASVDAITNDHILGVKEVERILETINIETNTSLSMKTVYPGLRMQNSGVNRNELLCILADRCEQDIFVFFLKYCGGEMTSEEFLGFCRLLKLLSKRDFSASCAVELFNNKGYHSGPECEAKINYRVFRFDILPEISSSKGRSVREMVNKICWTVIPSAPENPSHPSATSIDNKSCVKNGDGGIDKAQIAALRIQSFYRQALAVKHTGEEREIQALLACPSPSSSKQESVPWDETKKPLPQKITLMKCDGGSKKGSPAGSPSLRKCPGASTPPQPRQTASSPVDTEPLRQKCQEIFNSFCSSGTEMTSHDFVRLCYDTSLIPYETLSVNFTAMQARHIFRKVVAERFNPLHNVYEEGVVVGKRITFDVFWRVVVPHIAVAKDSTCHDIVSHINQSAGIKRMYTDEQGPRVISLLSNREYMNSKCDSFESVEYDISCLTSIKQANESESYLRDI